ncbi:protein of unknown function [Cupriavidus taiwanensis]|uniref:Uncharacterized protein n=1 Tax=Cupriavidus taiwanensis TaxID=164546 RepID=A0A7Z7NQG9_9BURK|nr:protein of unknown function [Cupriavidus taiwanensis]SPC23041.1 protein of unknown function [Cupriavidus taiwanensis]
MGVPADHDIHGGIELVDDRHDGAVQSRAALVVHRARGGRSAFMQQHHDRIDVLLAQFRNQLIDRIRLGLERQACGARGRHHRRRVLQRHADKGHLGPVEGLDLVCRQQRLAGRLVDDIGGQVLELRPGVRAVGHACVHADNAAPAVGRPRKAPAILQPQQLIAALVELMIAHRRDLQAHLAQHIDGRLLMERPGNQRRSADHVAGSHHHVIRILRLQALDQRGQVSGTARRNPCASRVGGILHHDAAARRFQVTVEIIEPDDLDRYRSIRGGGGTRRRRTALVIPRTAGGNDACKSERTQARDDIPFACHVANPLGSGCRQPLYAPIVTAS